ncbi:16S rRNA (guanine(527)-N(7))-methyltransferase RsmG [Ramlibacter sp. AW1]|uniref:Ribosomal RNA small subunit methyltransferase G n=1 Tax=Ramlibacter aurantiacus TaxID=2801330 RepID=A0A936ZH24_9BURK|nr:16S rRNA (guanine(527)-N(7))-methyltransferase RsmG [Ramlibacter aurantiacus]MBL0421299.1 16S rRNA (guanine(527)-N(7))-methyltransferase RsmG [Ramlibacter aurantiacus]
MSGDDPLEQRLRAGLEALALHLSDAQVQQLMAYLGLIQKWNRVYNLTAVRQPQEMLTHHLLDSLAIVAPLRRHARGRALRVLDVGSGAGLPGVVLAICSPEWAVDCVDTVAKKAAFIQQVAAALKLRNLRGLHARVETLASAYDVVCSRAFATLADFTAWSGRCLAAEGAWMAMKGKHPADEIAVVERHGVDVFHVEQLQVPGLEADRCLVWMKKREGLT